MLQVEGLNTHYGASHILQGVDLAVPAGGVSGILGRNGVGKTTLVRSIMGLIPSISGRILLDGQGIAGWSPHLVARAGVAYVPEGRLIFPELSVLENIRVGARRPAKVWTIERLLDLFPALRERAGNRGWQLSGGEQQMLAIARALASDPKMLLMDEPSQGLAPLVLQDVAEVIRQLSTKGVTILLIEQNMKLAEAVADKLHIMVKGRIVYGASPEVFREEKAAIQRQYLTV